MPDLWTLARTGSWLLPRSRWKNRLLRRFGDDVHPTASVGPTIVWRVGRIQLAARSRLGTGTQLRNLRAVHLDPDARIGDRCVISAHPVYAELYPDGARLSLGLGAVVTDRHHVDAAGGITLGAWAMLGGQGSQVLTHSIDLDRDVQAAHPITIGERSFIGAGCLLLGGAVLPPRSALAPGSTLVRSRRESAPGLWAGAPAIRTGPVTDPWFDRTENGEPPAGPQLPAEPADSLRSTRLGGGRWPVRGAGPLDLARALVWLLPASSRKNALLRRLGHQIHPTARATPNLVWRVAEFSMGERSRIAEANRLVGLRSFTMGHHSTVGRWNRVVSAGGDGILTLGDHAKLTGNHRVEATAGVTVEEFSTIAGRETLLLSAGSEDPATAPAPIRIGARSFVGTRCRVTAGAVLPDRSVLAAGSTLAAPTEELPSPGLWAGNPARHRRTVTGQWFDRQQTGTRRVFVPATGQTIEDAF